MEKSTPPAVSGRSLTSCSPLRADHPLTLYPLNKEDLDRMEQDVRAGKPTPYLETYALCRYLLSEAKCEFCNEPPLSAGERECMETQFNAKDSRDLSCSVIKKFGQDFDSDGGALTLDASSVTNTNAESGTHTRTHDSGWTITGELCVDCFIWVNDFTAIHPELGRVEGNFEDEVKATSEDAFAHFWKHHQPTAWNYHDI